MFVRNPCLPRMLLTLYTACTADRAHVFVVVMMPGCATATWTSSYSFGKARTFCSTSLCKGEGARDVRRSAFAGIYWPDLDGQYLKGCHSPS